MEPLLDSNWDVIISGTGLKNSLLALALSRSNKKILHIDQNKYYGDTNAAFSLQEVDEWVDKYSGPDSAPFRNATLWKVAAPDDLAKLSLSRSYTLTLSPFLIYSKSKLLTKLVSTTIYRQLEFQAVGNWWVFDCVENSITMNKIPNSREDIFQDKSLDNRSKRCLMKFLRFVLDYENQIEFWREHTESDLESFLFSQFQLPIALHKLIAALALTLYAPDKTMVGWALPRIARHLTSLGVLGPGFSSVVSKWGCGAEISQIACRACAVGGGVYILGTGVEKSSSVKTSSKEAIEVHLSNGYLVKTLHIISTPENTPKPNSKLISRIIAITTSCMDSLFINNIEGAPPPAVCVVVFPAGSIELEGKKPHPYPIYIMVHSSETGECPYGQYKLVTTNSRIDILYATTMTSVRSKDALEVSLSRLLKQVDKNKGKLIYSLYYEKFGDICKNDNRALMEQPTDLAFNDQMLEEIESEWNNITQHDDPSVFMKFQDKEDTMLEDLDTSYY